MKTNLKLYVGYISIGLQRAADGVLPDLLKECVAPPVTRTLCSTLPNHPEYGVTATGDVFKLPIQISGVGYLDGMSFTVLPVYDVVKLCKNCLHNYAPWFVYNAQAFEGEVVSYHGMIVRRYCDDV